MKYFTISELCRISVKITNEPSQNERLALAELINNVLDPAREELGAPITVNSGYRCKAVNAAVGGASTSQHLKGEAADLDCSDNAKLFEIIRDTLVFDQLIWEFGNDEAPAWVHVSYKTQGNRGEVLKAVKIKGKTKYLRL